MTEEKVLYFLGLEKNQKINKFIMKMFFCFDLSFAVFIILSGLILQLFSFSVLDFIFIFSSIIFCAIFFAFLKLITNPVYQFSYVIIVSITSIFKLLYGYYVYAKGEFLEYGYPIFTWTHLTVLIFSLLLALYVILKFCKSYKILKENGIERLSAKTLKASKMTKFVIIIASCSPIILIKLSENIMDHSGLGMGFACWLLMCCWIFLMLIFLPKYIVAMKYKAYKWFKKMN